MASEPSVLDAPLDQFDRPQRPPSGAWKRPPAGPPAATPLIGEWLTRPLHLCWIAVLPQAILLWYNLRAYHLAGGEMNATQFHAAVATFTAELALLAGCSALAGTLRLRRKPLSTRWNWALLGAALGYLAWVTVELTNLFPSTVPDWIVSSSEMLYYQYVLIMPLAFYAGLRLACYDSERSLWRDLAMTLGVGVGVIILAIALGQAAHYLPRFVLNAPAYLLVAIGVAVTLLMLGMLMRAATIIYVETRRKGPGAMAGLVVVVGLLGPFGGLWLNSSVPFPVDLQGWPVYALTLLNGLLLLVPNHRHPAMHRLVWLGQCALLPFSLYFFLVFLPLLPLCLPAMFVFGAGLLMLVPSALFAVHLQRLIDGYACEVRDGSRWAPAALGVGAALLLPALYVGGAWMDRTVLRGALDYAYTPSYRAARPFPGRAARVGRSLEHLRDYKAGLDLPFLTDLYKAIVFDGLVLPDEKMQRLHRVFLGRDLAPADTGRVSIFGHAAANGRNRGRAREGELRFVPPPATDVTLADVQQRITTEGPCDRAHVTLTMANTSPLPGEFVTQIHLPETVRVTGFWLHVGADRVPGRLVERKTALWVYHRIRDALYRRDPGLLLYTGPETAELRVYPFEAHQSRTVEFELLYPSALAPDIRVGDRTLATRNPAAADASTVVIAPAGKLGTTVTLTPDVVAALPSTVRRRPYLHFLVDRSEGSDVDAATLRRSLQAARAQVPEAREGWLTTVNYECREPLSSAPVPLDDLLAAASDAQKLEELLAPKRGGFLQERALRRGLLAAHDRLARSTGNDSAEPVDRYPVFVVVRGTHTTALPEDDEVGGPGAGGLKAWASLVPDRLNYYTVANGGSTVVANRFDPGAEAPVDEAQNVRRVALVCYGAETVACPVGGNEPQTLSFATPTNGPGPDRPILAALGSSSGESNRLVPLDAVAANVVKVPPDSTYARANEANRAYRALVEDPSAGGAGLTKLTLLSRATGVLTGATSYIVVENSAQWRILEEKEKQKLANTPALEIEQTPEPGTWVMIVLGGAGLLAVVWRQRRRAGQATAAGS